MAEGQDTDKDEMTEESEEQDKRLWKTAVPRERYARRDRGRREEQG